MSCLHVSVSVQQTKETAPWEISLVASESVSLLFSAVSNFNHMKTLTHTHTHILKGLRVGVGEMKCGKKEKKGTFDLETFRQLELGGCQGLGHGGLYV